MKEKKKNIFKNKKQKTNNEKTNFFWEGDNFKSNLERKYYWMIF
jgi:hypothetical protein